MDFLKVSVRRENKNKPPEICPVFDTRKSKDLMIRGGDFYAIWNPEKGFWSEDQDDAIELIDKEMERYRDESDDPVVRHAQIAYMWSSNSGSIDKWHKYVQKQTTDNFHPLDEKLIFQNTNVTREDYATKRLPYSLADGDHSAWDELLVTLYGPDEGRKIEWAIGAVVSGDSKKIQKFLVFYGSAGTGKSTILNIIEKLFVGYCGVFDSLSLGKGDSFSMESLKDNPLVAIQHDGDLSKIEDNTKLNSIISHETMPINTKYGKIYSMKFHSMLFMGTNRPVKITDSRSGIIRRLIDIRPTGNTFPAQKYNALMKKVDYELGAIAKHCLDVYEEDPGYYNAYVPRDMIGATNDFYNFVAEYYDDFYEKDSTTLQEAWMKYKAYCDEARVKFPYSRRQCQEELKNYFKVYRERYHDPNGGYFRNWYGVFMIEKFGMSREDKEHSQTSDMADNSPWLEFNTTQSLFDIQFAGSPAQYANEKTEAPLKAWDDVSTVLKDIDTTSLHYVRVPENLIVIDFDIRDENGEKSFEKNLQAAAKWPATYAELSKSGKGIHLHYIYQGDVTKLNAVYDVNIEVKVFKGKSALRRKLTRCNDIPIATLTSGLPLKKESKKMVAENVIKDEMHLRNLIGKALRKEIPPYATKTSIDFIDQLLHEAKENGIHYDVSDMKPQILAFAGGSSNNSLYCLDKAYAMEYASEEPSEYIDAETPKLIFFDCEVYPNLFIVVYKPEEKSAVTLINPTSDDIARLTKLGGLVGFNNRKYDNHVLYARMLGYDNFRLFTLSQNIINGGKDNSVRTNYMFREAYNLSYTDVYDFCAKKQSLKKWEIELGIHHQEMGIPWDEPVPEEMWPLVADYCKNDVIATEAVFHANAAAFRARQVLTELANTLVGPGSCVNDTTNTLTTKLIVGNEKNPQNQFVYPDLSKEFPGYEFNEYGIDKDRYLSPDVIVSGKSIYKGYDPGEGGFVFARHGMYDAADCYDSASHHPSSLIAENGFGPYTKNFKMLLDIRLHIKHKEYDEVRKMYNGVLSKYLTTDEDANELSFALKIAINSVYGLTAAKFQNKLRDPRNKDNWVAKRGALFMIDLMLEVEKRGYTVIHVKTDSIKIANPDKKIYQFVYDYGKKFGYTFEIEHKFEKLCLVDDANYICKYTMDPENGKKAGKWDATGDKFSHPVVFKSLFSHEPVEFDDKCETFTVAVGGGLYLDMNEDLPDVSTYEKERSKLISKWKKRKYELSDEHAKEAKEKPNENVEFLEDYSRLKELDELISTGHSYHFVGKAGSFCPMKPGTGGGLLVREKDGKYSYAGGSKGYRWMEAEVVKTLGKEDDIDETYYLAMIDKAIATINEYGDFDIFAEK